jgi:putative copper resistance protein D
VTLFLTFARAVHFGSCLLLESVFAVLLLVLIPVWDQSTSGAPCREKVQRSFQQMLAICLLLALVSGFVWLWLAIAGMNDSGPMEVLQFNLFWMVLSQTPPGHVWLGRLAITLIFMVTLLFWRRGSERLSLGLLVGAVLATLLTASLAWLGHAGAVEGPNQNLELGGDIVHLVAAGLWPAGLAPLALFLGCYLCRGREPISLLIARAATRRFSTLSLIAVGLLVISGIANSYFLVGSFRTLVATGYGRLLLLKLALFLAMMVFGAWNLFLSKRRILDGNDRTKGTYGTYVVDSKSLIGVGNLQDGALAVVARNVWIEIVLGAVILFVVGWLGIMPPAAHS